MANRQSFPRAVKFEIAKRAMRPDGQLACERCGAVGGKLELHHLRMDALTSDERKKSVKLTAADGALWCVPCHHGETAVQRKELARADAAMERHLGFSKPSSKLPAASPKRRATTPVEKALPRRPLFVEDTQR